MSEELRFDGKVAVITGAGNGLGRSHALLLAARGAKIVVNDLGGGAHGDGKCSAAADQVVGEIRALGAEAVANYDSVTEGARIIQCALDHFGRVDIVINNAGILRDSSFQKMSEEDWELIYRVHLYGSYKVTQAAWPHLREQGYGRVLMTTSAAGIYGNFGQANYSAAKLGLVGFASTLALEGRNKNVQVNVIAPIAGSRLSETVLPPQLAASLKPEYVSPLVAWLCHEHCQETGGLFEVGAGYVGKLRWERSLGHGFALGRGIAPEQIAAKWSAITDFSKSTHPATVAEAMGQGLENISARRRGGNEFLDLDAAAADEVVAESAYDERDLALYALGIGAAQNAQDDMELPFVYELGEGFQALPTYGVMPALNAFINLTRDGKGLKGLHYGLDRVLHGEQYTELTRPLPPKARLRHRFKFKDAYDKEKNAVVVLAVDTTDERGEKLAYNEISLFIRGAGGWGGERGPAAEMNVPPARAPDAVVAEKTGDNQALLYRLSGDWNPLHADPKFARAFGYDKPILHGLCTYGYVARHVIKAFCANDARRFKSIKVRFADSVFPGETLVTRMWKESETRIVFETRVKERDKLVIRNAAIELYAEIPRASTAVTAQPAVAAIAPEPAQLTAALAFEVIKGYVAAHPELVEKTKTVFQFKLRQPDSDWVLDLKNGKGECRPGVVEKPDCTLEMDAGHLDTIVSKPMADIQKLYFNGKLKISGNIMASQKLTVLQAIESAQYRKAVAAPAPAKAVVETPKARKAGRGAEIFAALEQRLAKNPKALNGLAGHVVEFRLSEPAASWSLDLRSAPLVAAGAHREAQAIFGIADEDLVALASSRATAHELFQRGRLRVQGELRLAKELAVFSDLIEN